jgi:hypothetical protein
MLKQDYFSAFVGQNLYDIAAINYGDTSLAMDLAIANNICLTDDLEAGQKIQLIEAKKNAQVLQVYKNTGSIPATAETEQGTTILLPPDGIGFMTIGTTFKVR